MKSPLDRFHDTINGRGASSFVWESIGYMEKTIARWAVEGAPEEFQQLVKTDQWARSIYDYFGIDWINFAPMSYHYSPAFDLRVLDDEGETEIVVDENGVVLRRSKASLSMPQYLEYPVRDMHSYEQLLFRRDPSSPERWNGDRWREWRQKSAHSQSPIGIFVIGFFAIVRELMGVQEGLVAFHTYPELVRRIVRDHCDFCLGLVRGARNMTRVDICYVWEDMSYKNGMLISPAFFEEFIVPEATRFIETVKREGELTMIVDSDGDIRELIPLYVRCGVDGFLPFEVQAGMDIRDIREAYSDLVIIGGIDKLAIAKGGEALENEISDKVDPMVKRGRYIPSLDHQAHPEMSLANYQRYIDRVKEYGVEGGQVVAVSGF